MKRALLVVLALLPSSCGGNVDVASGDAGDAMPDVRDTAVDSAPDTVFPDADPDAWVTGEYGGVYQTSFEVSAFYAGGPCSWSDVAYSLNADDPTFYDRVRAAGPAGSMVYVRFEGRLSPPGKYGHLGGYSREIVVTKVIDVSPLPPC